MANSTLRNTTQAFNIGSRGFIIKNLQKALGVKPDGIFGNQTARDTADLQRNYGLAPTGGADEATFRFAGVPWPDEFERCMNLTQCFEGTDFGDCNSTDIDGAGLTLGIAGFTTAHGEVQQLLAQYLAARGGPAEAALGAEECARVRLLLENPPGAAAWKQFFFGHDGKVRTVWRQAFLAWGRDPTMQALQLALARQRFWTRALADADRLKLRSLRGRCLMLDVAVQNGGWKTRHNTLLRRFPEWPASSETVRLAIIAHVVAQGAAIRWRRDVLLRKLTIALGQGIVHGRKYNLQTFALT